MFGMRPSLTGVLSVAFLAYMANSFWSLAKLYFPPECEKDCLASFLSGHSKDLRILLMTSKKPQPMADSDLTFMATLDLSNGQWGEESEQRVKVKLPTEVTNKNGSLYLAAFTTPAVIAGDISSGKWKEAVRHPDTTFSLVPLTTHKVPEAATFNLLASEDSEKGEKEVPAPAGSSDLPVVHIKSKMYFSIMTDDVALPRKEIPGEIYPLVRLTEKDKKKYLPIMWIDELSQRLEDQVKVNATDTEATIDLIYRPISWGKMRIFLTFSNSLHSMKGLGFTDKDTDEVKGIFADTNMALLAVTFIVSTVHLLFDFLAFKNDISFWSGRTDMTGLSTRTLVWRAFSQTIIFLYLMEESTSLLVLIPTGVSVIIEFWKVSKAFGFDLNKGFYRKFEASKANCEAEKLTEQIDNEAMRYLSYVLYPLLTGGAIYSLIYTPHKSWYSWTIQSAVNAVYAFGFLFMLPQLFVNYRLKSVAHLPWRSFMYKAFNTFIDDLFAFIITMPTAHRVACFRDDIVFLIYLYQRYLYPVDPNRVDTSTMMDETTETTVTKNVQDTNQDNPVRRSQRLKAE